MEQSRPADNVAIAIQTSRYAASPWKRTQFDCAVDSTIGEQWRYAQASREENKRNMAVAIISITCRNKSRLEIHGRSTVRTLRDSTTYSSVQVVSTNHDTIYKIFVAFTILLTKFSLAGGKGFHQRQKEIQFVFFLSLMISTQ
jgi:hypothetical protein